MRFPMFSFCAWNLPLRKSRWAESLVMHPASVIGNITLRSASDGEHPKDCVMFRMHFPISGTPDKIFSLRLSLLWTRYSPGQGPLRTVWRYRTAASLKRSATTVRISSLGNATSGSPTVSPAKLTSLVSLVSVTFWLRCCSITSPLRINSRQLKIPSRRAFFFHWVKTETSAIINNASSGHPTRVSIRRPHWNGIFWFQYVPRSPSRRLHKPMNLGPRSVVTLARMSIHLWLSEFANSLQYRLTYQCSLNSKASCGRHALEEEPGFLGWC